MTMGLMEIGFLVGSPGVSILAGGMTVATLALAAFYGSHRVQRRVSGSLARWVGRFQPERRRRTMSLLGRLAAAKSLAEFFEELPWIASRAAGVAPVTLFLLEGDRFVANRSTRLVQRPGAVCEDDPLASLLRRSAGVHYLRGRKDDLQNAPLHAVNGAQIEACRAVAAVPLKHGQALVGFLLCGGPDGSGQPSLASMSALEWVARRCREALARLEATSPSAETQPGERDVTITSWATPARTPARVAAVAYEGNQRIGAEPQLAGVRGGCETTE
jgi:hypothetical protein